ncbi:MAG TPA: DnaJ family domain-containing protein [Anaerolineae bacterium]|nr:DnaJ family domain-containing protein [Anaerolineae bacterium]
MMGIDDDDDEQDESWRRPSPFWRRKPKENEIEEQIEEAMRQGKFDNLRGAGKPLDLKKNPYAAEEEDLAHQLLRDNQYTLPWISARTDVLTRIEQLKTDMARAWAYYYEAYRAAGGPGERVALSMAWDRRIEAWEQGIVVLNREIELANLKNPVSHLEIYKLDFKYELEKLGAVRRLERLL